MLFSGSETRPSLLYVYATCTLTHWSFLMPSGITLQCNINNKPTTTCWPLSNLYLHNLVNIENRSDIYSRLADFFKSVDIMNSVISYTLKNFNNCNGNKLDFEIKNTNLSINRKASGRSLDFRWYFATYKIHQPEVRVFFNARRKLREKSNW